MTQPRFSMQYPFLPTHLRQLLLLTFVVFGLTAYAGDADAVQRKTVTKKSASAKPLPTKLVAKIRVKNNSGLSSARESKSSNYAGVSSRKIIIVRHVVPSRLSHGQLAGLHETPDELELKSSVALVIDQDTREVLVRKNDSAVLPIASLTKLMTALLISEDRLPMDEAITITQADVDTEKGSRSRLAVGTTLSRGEMLHLALMSSENRAANALGRTHPNGMDAFVRAMNTKAKSLGMRDTRYVEPTGLSSQNRSSAQDLATLVAATSSNPVLRQLSTSLGYQVDLGTRVLQYNNTNKLVGNPEWDIGLQKTGYISEAGRCLVMQARVAGRKLIMVFLDSSGKFSRLGDAERVKRWVESQVPTTIKVMPALPAALDGDVVVRRVSG